MNLLGSDLFLRLLINLFAALLVAAPRPLNLDGSDVVHGEAMVFEEAPRQGHLVGRLDETGTEVAHALLLVLGHHVER